MAVKPTFVFPRAGLTGAREIQAALDALFAFNVAWRRLYGSAFKPLLSSHVRYAREWPRERWLTLPELYREGVGDCEDLAAAYAAELVSTGRDTGARPYVRKANTGRGYHVVVLGGNGRELDPSIALGMGASETG